MNIILSDFCLSSHLCFCQALGIDFVICNAKKLILKTCPSDNIYLILPILSTGKGHWPWFSPQVAYIRSQCSPAMHWAPCVLGFFILPVAEGEVSLSSLLYFIFYDYVGKSRLIFCAPCFLQELRSTNRVLQ